jgi:hypothetical protein
VNKIHLLPSGIFNELFYDFICCEDPSPCFSLQCEDLLVAENSLYCGIVSLWLSWKIALESEQTHIITECKEYSSIQDLFSLTGSTAMTQKIPIHESKSEQDREKQFFRGFTPIISTDYCLIRCSRCSNGLGEAKLDLSKLDSLFEENNTSNDPDWKIPIEAIAHLQLNWSAIKISILKNNTAIQTLQVTIEEIAARLLLYIVEKYTKSFICFYVPIVGILAAENDYNSLQKTPILIVKVLSKQSAVTHYNASFNRNITSRSSLSAVVKVSFEYGNLKNQFTGREVRIPLEIESFNELVNILESRHQEWRTYFESFTLPVKQNNNISATKSESICFLHYNKNSEINR